MRVTTFPLGIPNKLYLCKIPTARLHLGGKSLISL
jgi:hypothetical protein